VRRLVVDRLDHTLLNDLIDNPSAERVVMWIWNELKDFRRLLREEIADPNLAEDLRGYIQSDAAPDLTSSDISQVKLYEIQLWETEDSFVTYRGDL
jgi:6-pyruvoyl-tetrahydropterin synthase